MLVILSGEGKQRFIMKTGPCRPLILQRWTLPLLVQNAPGETSEEEP